VVGQCVFYRLVIVVRFHGVHTRSLHVHTVHSGALSDW
jgi:hypothetical protein